MCAQPAFPGRPMRGMTLVELLVVVAIIGLLAVAVAPILVTSTEKKHLEDAAGELDTHINQVAARALTSRTGAAVWLETDSAVGGGSGVLEAGIGRVPLGAAGQTTVTVNVGLTTAAVSLINPITGSLISFGNTPSLFQVDSATQISLTPTALNATLRQTINNAAIPDSPTDPLPYVITRPPEKRLSSRPARFRNGTCIDFTSSTIGLEGFAGRTGADVHSLAAYRKLAIVFDNTGKPSMAWATTDPSATPTSWDRFVLDPTSPIVLLVAMAYQVGLPYVASPTEDDPGEPWQNPYARWVVIDPKTGQTRIIESRPGQSTKEAAQAFVLQSLQTP